MVGIKLLERSQTAEIQLSFYGIIATVQNLEGGHKLYAVQRFDFHLRTRNLRDGTRFVLRKLAVGIGIEISKKIFSEIFVLNVDEFAVLRIAGVLENGKSLFVLAAEYLEDSDSVYGFVAGILLN